MTDTHAHLDTSKFAKDVDLVIERAIENGVKRFIIPSINSTDMNGIIALADKYEEVFFSAGYHPNRLDNYSFEAIETLINHPKCVAVGECGLDYYRLKGKSNISELIKLPLRGETIRATSVA